MKYTQDFPVFPNPHPCPMTRSLPLARPLRACRFAPIPFAGGLLHSRSVSLRPSLRKSFSQLPKLLKSQAAQVPSVRLRCATARCNGRGRTCSSVGRKGRFLISHVAAPGDRRCPGRDACRPEARFEIVGALHEPEPRGTGVPPVRIEKHRRDACATTSK